MNVQAIYDGSDGEATKALYARLTDFGPIGAVAVNLFRAQKTSSRAKVYRGGVRGQGSYKSMSYERKEWSLANLCAVLAVHADALGIRYGWQADADTPGYAWVLYVDLPTGQVSFHAPRRGLGPEYAGTWDGVRDVSAHRIVRYVQALLNEPSEAIAQTIAAGPVTLGPLWCAACKCWWTNRTTCLQCRSPLQAKPLPTPLPELRPGVRAEWQ